MDVNLPIDLAVREILHSVLEMVPRQLATRRCVVPVSVIHGILVVAAEDPDDADLLDEIQFVCNREVRLIRAIGILAAIRRYYVD
jgi:hypothetical protein